MYGLPFNFASPRLWSARILWLVDWWLGPAIWSAKPNYSMVFRVHKNFDLHNLRSCRHMCARAAHAKLITQANAKSSVACWWSATSLIWRLTQLAWYFNIVPHPNNRFVSTIRMSLDSELVPFVYQLLADPGRFHQETFWLWDETCHCSHCTGQGSFVQKWLVWYGQYQCTALHIHAIQILWLHITDAIAREESRCFLSVFKRYKDVLPSLGS